jgi:ABC-type branched-subunit amino acid transport system substrate-binding protein
VALSLLAATSLVAACGSDGGDSAKANDDKTTGSTAAPAGDLALDRPLKLAFMWEVKGESPVAVNDFDEGAQLAVKEINAAGGVGGHPIEVVRFPAPPTDPQALSTNFQKAVEAKPDVIIGFPSPDSPVVLHRQIEDAGVPVLTASPPDTIRFGAPGGSEWVFSMQPSDGAASKVGADFFVTEKGLKRIAGLYTDLPSYRSQLGAVTARVKELGGEMVLERGDAPTVKDLSEAILSLKDKKAEAVVDFGYPNPLALALQQMAQNGIDIPVLAGGSAGPVANGGLVDKSAMKNFYSVIPCNVTDSSRPKTADYAAAFEKEYGRAPAVAQAAQTYDAVYLAVQAVKAAGSTDHDAVRKALETGSFEGGACASAYKADGAHLLSHEAVIVKVPELTTEHTYKIPPQAKLAG